MKTNTLFRSALAAATAAFLFSACIKDDEPTTPEPTTSEKLVGTWKMTFEADDDNTNNLLEESEKTPRPAGEDIRFTFRADSSLAYMVKYNGVGADSGTGTWSIVDGDYLRYVLHTSVVKNYKLHTLDSASLIFEDSSAHPMEWTGFAKQ
jgi:hypothetical protein